jgi:hypothetical protein
VAKRWLVELAGGELSEAMAKASANSQKWSQPIVMIYIFTLFGNTRVARKCGVQTRALQLPKNRYTGGCARVNGS